MNERYSFPRLRRYHKYKTDPLHVIAAIMPNLFGLTIADLIIHTNEHKYSKRRHLAMTVLSRHSNLNNKTIGIFFGYHSHCMVSHACRFVEALEFKSLRCIVTDPYLAEYKLIESTFIAYMQQ